MVLTALLIAAILAATLPLGWAVIGVLKGIGDAISSAPPPQIEIQVPEAPAPVVQEHPDIAGLVLKMNELTQAVADGIQRVQRSENRVRAIVNGARRELASAGFEHAGVEAEASELRSLDGDAGEDDGVQLVPEDVGVPEETASSIPGVSREQLHRAIVR